MLPALAPGPRPMDPDRQLQDLTDAAEKLSIRIETCDLGDEEFPARGGYCRVRDRSLILLDRRLDAGERVRIILEALSRFDLEAVYLPSWIREELSAKL